MLFPEDSSDVGPYDDDVCRPDIKNHTDLGLPVPTPFDRLHILASYDENGARLDEARRAGNWERWCVLAGDAIAALDGEMQLLTARASRLSQELADAKESEQRFARTSREEFVTFSSNVRTLLRRHQDEAGVTLSGPQERVLALMADRIYNGQWAAVPDDTLEAANQPNTPDA